MDHKKTPVVKQTGNGVDPDTAAHEKIEEKTSEAVDLDVVAREKLKEIVKPENPAIQDPDDVMHDFDDYYEE